MTVITGTGTGQGTGSASSSGQAGGGSASSTSTARQQQIGPFTGRYHPDYHLKFWHDGDPRQPITNVNLRSVVAIQTSKSLDDISGTFTITLKDGRARGRIHEMDTVRIALRGHSDDGYTAVLKGVVDTVRQGGSADVYASREDTVIEGRCMAKYLQVTSLFLPVWDPRGLLPTALLFGLGDASKKVKDLSPFGIFEYLINNYTYGKRNVAGVSGVPNSRFWLNYKSRFQKLGFKVPFVQFDEDAMSDALKRFEITGYTEAWVDELGNIVYRHPAWDRPAKYRLPAQSLTDWDFPRSDVGATTYVEVIPAGDPGIDSAAAQALRAGRAPVPSSYLHGPQTAHLSVGPEFVIATDAKGKVTPTGAKNHWYKRQRHLGLRPQQITSPLLVTQEQAQAQAEGLLQFYSRMIKTAQLTIPGYPTLRLGENVRCYGELDGVHIDRTFYIDQISHEYVESTDGGSYTTSFRGSHGRDPWDPKWGTIAIPKFDPAKLSQLGGILGAGGGGAGGTGAGGSSGGSSGSSGGGGQQTSAKAGIPVLHLISIGGLHPTAGLPGYPAHDYFAPAGSPCVSPVNGVVHKLSGHDPASGPPQGPHGPFGWSVYISGGGHDYYLTHMGSRSVHLGQHVRQGEQIGTVGNYAKWGGSNHIHMGVH